MTENEKANNWALIGTIICVILGASVSFLAGMGVQFIFRIFV